MEQTVVTNVTNALLSDDDGDRPTIPAHVRFDRTAEHFFSNAETMPELVPDARFLAQLALAIDEDEVEASAWWVEQRRSRHLRLVAMVCTACIALLFAGVVR